MIHRLSNCHGSWVPGPILTVSCLCACAYVWAGVCGCVWLRLIRSSWESSPLGYICSCHALSFVRSLQCLRSSFTVRSGSAIAEPCCFLDSDRRTFGCPLLPCATCLCPTESSVSAYGKLRFCLRKAPLLPTESSASAYEELHFSFSLCITSCNKLSVPQLNPPVFIVTEGSDQSSWIQRRLVVCKNWYPATTLVWISRRRICWTPDELCRR